MHCATATVRRTIDCTSTGSRFVEGPVAISGQRLLSVQAEDISDGGPRWTNGVVELKGEIAGGLIQSFNPAAVLTASSRFLESAGSGDLGPAPFAMIDCECTTAENGLRLLLTIRLVPMMEN